MAVGRSPAVEDRDGSLPGWRSSTWQKVLSRRDKRAGALRHPLRAVTRSLPHRLLCTDGSCSYDGALCSPLLEIKEKIAFVASMVVSKLEHLGE